MNVRIAWERMYKHDDDPLLLRITSIQLSFALSGALYALLAFDLGLYRPEHFTSTKLSILGCKCLTKSELTMLYCRCRGYLADSLLINSG